MATNWTQQPGKAQMPPLAFDAALQACPAGEIADTLREILAPALSPLGLAQMCDAELLAWVAGIENLGNIVDAARHASAAEVVDRCAHPIADKPTLTARTGCRSAYEILERLTGQSVRTLRQRVALGDLLRPRQALSGELLPARLPVLAAASQAGLISMDASQLIAATVGRLDNQRVHPGDLAAAEIGLVSVASGRAHQPLEALAAGGRLDPHGTWEDDRARADALLALPRADAGRFTSAELDVAARAWTLAIDPDGALPAKTSRRRGLSLGRMRGGLVPVKGHLQVEVAAQLGRLFDAYLNPRTKTAIAAVGAETMDITGAEEPTGDPQGVDADPDTETSGAGPQDQRSWDEKRHDAFAGILAAAAANPAGPLIGGAPPVLVVTVDADQLCDGTPGGREGVAFIQGHQSHTGHDGAMNSRQALHLGCTGAIQRVVTDSRGQILSLSSPQRVFTVHQRRAIMARDGGCVVPGCTVPADWCEIHHVQSWKDGGPTHTDNGVLLCWHHHRNLDTLGWEIRMNSGIPRLVQKPNRLRQWDRSVPRRRIVSTALPGPWEAARSLRQQRRSLIRPPGSAGPPGSVPGPHEKRNPPRRC